MGDQQGPGYAMLQRQCEVCLSRWGVGVLTEQTSDLASGGSSVTDLGKVVVVKQWAPSSMRSVRIGSEEERDRDLKISI